MARFPLTATFILALLAILTIGRYSPDLFQPHQITKEDRRAILEAQKVLSNLNCTMIRLDFSTEKEERYSICYNSRDLSNRAGISLTSYGHDRKDFKKVSNQLIKIFEKKGIKVETMRINDWVSDFQQTIVLENCFPEQLSSLMGEFGKYFCNLEIVNWTKVPNID